MHGLHRSSRKGSRSTSPSTGRTSRATTCGGSTGGCTRAPTATTSRSTRPTPTPSVLLRARRPRRRWTSAAGAVTKFDYARIPRRVPGLALPAAGRPRGAGDAGRRARRDRAALGAAPAALLHTLGRAKAHGRGEPLAHARAGDRCRTRAGDRGGGVGLLRGSRRAREGARHAARPRARCDPLPSPRPRGARAPLRRADHLRGRRDRAPHAAPPGGAARAVPRWFAAHRAALEQRVAARPRGLRRGRHRPAARPRAARYLDLRLCGSRAADGLGFLVPAFLAGARGPGDSGAHAPAAPRTRARPCGSPR